MIIILQHLKFFFISMEFPKNGIGDGPGISLKDLED